MISKEDIIKGLRNSVVDCIKIGAHQLTVCFSSGWSINCESLCYLGGVAVSDYVGRATELCRMIGMRVLNFSFLPDEGLVLNFDTGFQFEVRKNDSGYESYQIYCDNNCCYVV
jgi:hypothetical protein